MLETPLPAGWSLAAHHHRNSFPDGRNMTVVFDPPFIVLEPAERTLPFVFNSPHSGCHYPEEFLNASRLSPHTLRKSEDAHVDALFSGVTELGAPLMHAQFPRAYLDVNREPFELDPAMFDRPLPTYVNNNSVRVAGGLGTIARIVGEAHEIYREPLTFADAQRRIKTLYKPYHSRLKALIDDTARQFGTALLIDCHSMPSTPDATQKERGLRPDIVLGDRFGTTCDERITGFFESRLTRIGYAVVRNKPYSGGFITQTYGVNGGASHALQIEINRDLYMDEETLEKNDGFDRLARDLLSTIADLARIFPGSRSDRPLAAE